MTAGSAVRIFISSVQRWGHRKISGPRLRTCEKRSAYRPKNDIVGVDFIARPPPGLANVARSYPPLNGYKPSGIEASQMSFIFN